MGAWVLINQILAKYTYKRNKAHTICLYEYKCTIESNIFVRYFDLFAFYIWFFKR